MSNVIASSGARARARGVLVAMLLASTALGGIAATQLVRAADNQPATGGITVPANRAVPDFADLAAQVRPAVVSITSTMVVAADDDEEGATRPMRPGRRGQPGPGARSGEARGSGFIVDAKGIIVTNNHVVRDATEVSVTLDDGTVLPARVIGKDTRTDIAVLKVDAPGKLPFLQLGDSGAVRPGEWVIAMGNPFGLGGSITAGIVSALGRDIGSGPYDQFIQIDAPINQGNSGGPLFTQDGRVIGINTAILSPSGGSIGIGFAIPSNLVKTVVADLTTSGRVARGFIGLHTQPVAPEMAQALNLPSAGGALVAEVEQDSPAAKAGIRPGDVVRAVNTQKIATPRDLALAISAVHPGETVKLDVLRDGSAHNLSLAVAQMPGEQRAEAAAPADAEPAAPRIGLALAPVEGQRGGAAGAGAMVAEVGPGTPAERAGIQAGDVITSVGSKSVATPEEAVKAIRAAASGKAVALRVVRDGRTMFVAVKMDAKPANQG
jgi:serine protease Do